ncbi:MurR/RpiR family transcriptional regulator [Enterococcus ratti]|nr:MurR/RpiR family transcriptional regulator [Enterococcus ratti]
MNVLMQMQQNRQHYTTVEQKIVDFIIDDPQAILTMSVHELASKLSISSATVVRFSKMIGLKGFTDLKQHISAALTKIISPESLQEVAKNDSVAKIKKKVLVRMNHMADQVNAVLEDEQVEQATKLIGDSKHVLVFGLGASSLVAQDIFQKFSRIGKQCFVTTDITLMATSMTVFKEKACFIAISNSGETTEVVKLSNLADSLAIPVIGITGQIHSYVASKAAIVLTPTSGETIPVRTAATMSLMAQLFVVDILFYHYVSQNFEESMSGIKHTKNIDL